MPTRFAIVTTATLLGLTGAETGLASQAEARPRPAVRTRVQKTSRVRARGKAATSLRARSTRRQLRRRAAAPTTRGRTRVPSAARLPVRAGPSRGNAPRKVTPDRPERLMLCPTLEPKGKRLNLHCVQRPPGTSYPNS